MLGLGTRLSQGPDGVYRPNDPEQPHLGAQTQALPISPQAMAVSASCAVLKLCLCPVLPLALSPGWTPWTHAVTLSAALPLDFSSAVPDWSPWIWFVPLLCLILLIDPVISPGSAPCVQQLRDSVRGCGHGLCCGQLCSQLACTSRAANLLCPQQDGPLGDHYVVQSLPVSVSDPYCGDAMVHDAVIHESLWLMGLDSCLTSVLLKCLVLVGERLVLFSHISLQPGSRSRRL